MTSKLISKPRLTIAACAVGILGLAGCGAANSSASGSPASHGKTAGRGGTLTMGTEISIGSLDPAKGNAGTDAVYDDPIYAPLFRYGSNGKLQGVLASSWRYVGTGNRTFQITLRRGVTFSNGQPVNAAAVVGSLKHYETGTDGGQWLVGCPGLSTLSALVIQVTCKQPDPDLPLTLTDLTLGGDVVAPASLANPSTLGSDPIGAGEYVLDTAQTVAGSSYTYTANPRYFDQKAIHWNKIVVKYFANPTTGLDALRSGQIEWLLAADPQSIQAAKSAGDNVSVSPLLFEGVELADRSPAGGNPLGKLGVRQALEYAVDRPVIVKALLGSYGSATDQVAVPSQPTSWDPAVNNYYPYDPAKAKALLASAGYPHGFTIDVEDQALDSELTQAVIGYWNKIGVKANVTTDTTTPGWIHNALSRKFAVIGYGYGGLPMFMEAINWFEPVPNIYNPFATDDSAILGLLAKASSAPSSQQTADFEQVQAAGVQQAWYVGVAVVDGGVLSSTSVAVPPVTGSYFFSDDDVTPAS